MKEQNGVPPLLNWSSPMASHCASLTGEAQAALTRLVGRTLSPRSLLAQPFMPEGAKLDGNEGAGEVQTPVHYAGPISLAIGDLIFMRHSKAGELCERFTQLLLVSKGIVIDEVNTYRGDGQSFI